MNDVVDDSWSLGGVRKVVEERGTGIVVSKLGERITLEVENPSMIEKLVTRRESLHPREKCERGDERLRPCQAKSAGTQRGDPFNRQGCL